MSHLTCQFVTCVIVHVTFLCQIADSHVTWVSCVSKSVWYIFRWEIWSPWIIYFNEKESLFRILVRVDFFGISRSPKSYGFCDLKIWDLNSERFVKRISSKSIKSVFFFVSVIRIGLGLVVGLGLAQFTDFGSTWILVMSSEFNLTNFFSFFLCDLRNNCVCWNVGAE